MPVVRYRVDDVDESLPFDTVLAGSQSPSSFSCASSSAGTGHLPTGSKPCLVHASFGPDAVDDGDPFPFNVLPPGVYYRRRPVQAYTCK